MLEIRVPKVELYDESLEEFTYIRGQILKLEHSLVSLAKWESIWSKAFLSPKLKMSPAETMSYIRCMTITQNVNPVIFDQIYRTKLQAVYAYIERPMSATVFRKTETPRVHRESITAELIYYWMTVFAIPFTCEKWHLNRLLTLINVCNIKQQPKKKMSMAALHRRNHDLNRQRLDALKTTG